MTKKNSDEKWVTVPFKPKEYRAIAVGAARAGMAVCRYVAKLAMEGNRIKKAVAIASFALLAGGCNQGIFNFDLKFDKAYIRFPDGSTKTFKVKEWWYYKGKQIQIMTDTGRILLFPMNNVVLEGRW